MTGAATLREVVAKVADYHIVRSVGCGVGGFPNIIEAMGATMHMREEAMKAALAWFESDEPAELLAVLREAREWIAWLAEQNAERNALRDASRLLALIARMDSVAKEGS